MSMDHVDPIHQPRPKNETVFQLTRLHRILLQTISLRAPYEFAPNLDIPPY